MSFPPPRGPGRGRAATPLRRPGRRGAAPLLLIPAAVAALFLLLPLIALLVRAPWRGLAGALAGTEVTAAMRLSLGTATVTTGISLALGVPLAWVLARLDFPGRSLLRVLVILPVIFPPVVGGVALLLAFGRRGLLGQVLYSAAEVSLPFSTAAVVMAQTFVAMPFLVLAVEGALRGADRRYDDAAATLGASGLYTFRRVTLPLIAPGVAAGAVLCWARALGEFGATITFAGNFPGVTRTMPLAVYLALETDPAAAVVLSLVLVAVCAAVLVGLRERWLPSA